MQCEECGSPLWKAGEMAPVGRYIRLGDISLRMLVLDQPGILPAAFDGHIALYQQAGFPCTCIQLDSRELVLPQANEDSPDGRSG